MTEDQDMLQSWRASRETALIRLRALESGRMSAIARGSDTTEIQIATLGEIVTNYDLLISLLEVSTAPPEAARRQASA